ncbi:MAG TPA: hypothetical protein VGP89_17885 [Candidatus Angelobacter sp.]|nr:hypothetical protein [Candidatus Angelobacter sp.]
MSTAKLVRAKVKLRENMPEWARCCEEGLRIIEVAQGREMVVNLDCRMVRGCFCLKCQEGNESATAVYIESGRIGMGCWYPLEWLDLDEGPVAA